MRTTSLLVRLLVVTGAAMLVACGQKGDLRSPTAQMNSPSITPLASATRDLA
ncbi:MAG: lipoprotein [Betaproteobacteria bacterium]|nr:lipoprotein [Betaproteobacteria bacterium]